jgi:hypothetical protein
VVLRPKSWISGEKIGKEVSHHENGSFSLKTATLGASELSWAAEVTKEYKID